MHVKIIFLTFCVSLSCLLQAEEGNSLSMRADLNGDEESDFIDVFSLALDENNLFPSLAVVSLNRGGHRRPIRAFSHSGRFPDMLQVRVVDLNNDGKKELLIGRVNAGVSHSYLEVQIYRMNNEDGLELIKEMWFQDQSLDEIMETEF